MKKQRYRILLSMLVLGICAGVLRGSEVAYHFDWSTAMFEPFATSFIVPSCTALVVLLTVLFGVTTKGKTGDYCETWKLRGAGGVVTEVVGALGMIVTGLLTMWLYTVESMVRRPSYAVFGILTVLTGIVLLTLTLKRRRGQLSEYDRFFSSLAVVWSCYLLVLTYMEHPVEPVIRVFCYDIFAVCFITLALFCEISTIFRAKKRGWVLFCTLNAIFFILMTLVGRLTAFRLSGETDNLLDAPIRMILFIFIGLRLWRNAFALLSAEPENE